MSARNCHRPDARRSASSLRPGSRRDRGDPRSEEARRRLRRRSTICGGSKECGVDDDLPLLRLHGGCGSKAREVAPGVAGPSPPGRRACVFNVLIASAAERVPTLDVAQASNVGLAVERGAAIRRWMSPTHRTSFRRRNPPRFRRWRRPGGGPNVPATGAVMASRAIGPGRRAIRPGDRPRHGFAGDWARPAGHPPRRPPPSRLRGRLGPAGGPYFPTSGATAALRRFGPARARETPPP
jgi:hypothetical protein